MITLLLCSFLAADPVEGVLPTDATGQPLNLDFETGDLRDWVAEGEAFKNQPIEGDTVSKRRGDMKSRHQGKYWIGGWERFGDAPTGTLTSVPFKVTHPYATFLVGGGPNPTTRVEIVLKESNWVLHHFSGLAEEDMRRVVVDLRPQMGKEIYIRLVDQHTGHWGHINFDDFRFHNEKPDVPERPAPREAPEDVIPYAGLPPEQAASVMTVPEGFTVKLFAGEPDVMQPIGFCLDDRGRLWVAEAYTYPRRAPEGQGKDRIVIFEDSKGVGKFDKRTVFTEGLNLVSGIEYGFGGLWVGAAPYFMFIPIDASGDKPAGPPKILLDGWHYEDTHETLNTFTWGPDGWLYGCHGVFTHSRVGKPGTPDKDRIPINAGIWRYHPVRHEFEVFAHGTSNPWGLDFDEHGQMFIEACVIPHCYHIIQGGRYERQAGNHFNPYTYDDIKTIADHLHYAGATPHGGNNRSDTMGGGHAHCGLLCYQGGAWPEEYRGKIFMGNIHGRRINMDVLKPKGSGFIASHGPDFLKANDAWARFINMRTAPDGNVYLIDWYDKQACHDTKADIWDRTNGRIYKICYRGTKPVTGADLAKESDKRLVECQGLQNVWYSRHARRILQERWAKQNLDTGSDSLKKGILEKNSANEVAKTNRHLLEFFSNDEATNLRLLWTLHLNGDTTNRLSTVDWVFQHSNDPIAKAWAIQLLLEQAKQSDISQSLQERFSALAGENSHSAVRLAMASGLQRMKLNDRWKILHTLLTHSEDAADPNLPLMYWYAAEPLAAVDAPRALALARNGKIPQIYDFMARRIAAIGTPEAFALLVKSLNEAKDDADRLVLIRGIQDGLKGRRQVQMPTDWPAAFAKLQVALSAELRERGLAVALSFGDPAALGKLREIVQSPKAELRQRASSLASLIDARDPDLAPVLQQLVSEPALRGQAIRGLANYADPKTPGVLLAVYDKLPIAEKRDALNVYVSRPAYAAKLLDAIAEKKIPSADVPAEIVRQLRNMKDPELNARLTKVWGIVRDTPTDRGKMIAEWKKKLSVPPKTQPDLGLGRALFAKTCQQCHTLYGVGGNNGPDITGSNRSDLDYLLENILDPNAIVPNEYMMTKFTLASGRLIEGIVKQETATALTVATTTETLTIPAADIEHREPTSTSLMPDDLIKSLSDDEVRALVAYLRHNKQVPMLATEDNVKDFFNGKDLAGWDGDPKLWSVQNGEIVGKSPGIPKNEFLKSHIACTDFRLTVQVKLTPDKENSGIQFRSEPLANGEMRGPQADVGAGWWGKLYDESGRGTVWNKPGDQHVKKDDWNDYKVEAIGGKVKTWINGQLCVDLDDSRLSQRGIFGLQIHSGGPMEVRFRNFKLECLATPQRGER
jgi:putative membrane-bound dehydrogenase-like protein